MGMRVVHGLNSVQILSWDGSALSFAMGGRYENDGEGIRRVHDAPGCYYDLPAMAIVHVRPMEVEVPDENQGPKAPEMTDEEIEIARRTMHMQQEAIRKARREAQEALRKERESAAEVEAPSSPPGPAVGASEVEQPAKRKRGRKKA